MAAIEIERRGGVAFTGQCDDSRNDIGDDARIRGWQVYGTVTPDIDFLVEMENQASSLKKRKARNMGIAIITYRQWLVVRDTGELI